MLEELLRGASFLPLGFRRLNSPGLRRYVAIPLFLNVILFGLSAWLLIDLLSAQLEATIASLPSWLQWLRWLAWVVFGIAFLLLGTLAFTLVANLIGAPFNVPLARRIGGELGVSMPEDTRAFLPALAIELVVAIGRVLRFLGASLALLLLLLVPGAGLVVPVLWAALGAWMLCEEYSDPALEVHGLSHAERRLLLRRHRWRSLGFGSAALACTLIPILNLAVMPAAVAGAMLLWSEHSIELRGSRNELA